MTYQAWVGMTEALYAAGIITRRDYHDMYGRWPTKEELRKSVTNRPVSAPFSNPPSSRCDCCGASDYVFHDHMYICSYCRSAG